MGGGRLRRHEVRLGKIKSLREDLWSTLWDLGTARRRASVLLWKGGVNWAAHREVREYQAVVLDCIKLILSALEFPDPAITIVSAFHGEADDGSFHLEEVQWAEELLRKEHEHFEEAD